MFIAQGCFWVGEHEIGQIDGVVTTEAGFLDGQYTVFGRVLEGLDVLDAIATAPVRGEQPTEPVRIQSVEVIENAAS